jgi:DNA invertase Pin-like site-specific DNA recombinase
MRIGLTTLDQKDAFLRRGPDLDRLHVAERDIRTELKALLPTVHRGDVLVVLSARPLIRSMPDLVRIIGVLVENGADLEVLAQPWFNSAGDAGAIVAGLAELDQDFHHERTSAGRERAQKSGIPFGRPPKLSRSQRIAAADMHAAGMPQVEIAKFFAISPATVSAIVREHTERVDSL